MDAGLSWHMERPEHRIWKLVEQAEGTPDQGLEKVKGHKETKTEVASRHEPRCQIPPGFRKEQRRLQREKDKKKKQKAAEKQQGKSPKYSRPPPLRDNVPHGLLSPTLLRLFHLRSATKCFFSGQTCAAR